MVPFETHSAEPPAAPAAKPNSASPPRETKSSAPVPAPRLFATSRVVPAAVPSVTQSVAAGLPAASRSFSNSTRPSAREANASGATVAPSGETACVPAAVPSLLNNCWSLASKGSGAAVK